MPSHKVGEIPETNVQMVTRLNAAMKALDLNNCSLGRLTGYARETCSRFSRGVLDVPPLIVTQLEMMVPMYEALMKAKR